VKCIDIDYQGNRQVQVSAVITAAW
jgi:hypothetical protein